MHEACGDLYAELEETMVSDSLERYATLFNLSRS